MPNFLFFKQIMTDGIDINTVSDELSHVELANIEELTYYFVFKPDPTAVTAGAVQPETNVRSAIKEPVLDGSWSPEGSPTTFTADGTKHVMISGITMWRRVRISTAIVGGSVDVYVMGR